MVGRSSVVASHGSETTSPAMRRRLQSAVSRQMNPALSAARFVGPLAAMNAVELLTMCMGEVDDGT